MPPLSNTNKNKKTNLFLTFPACLDIYSRPRSETGVTAVATGPPRRGASSLPKEVPVQSPIPAREGKQSRGAGLSPDASPASRCVCSQWLSLVSLASLTSSREGVTDRPRPGGPVTPCVSRPESPPCAEGPAGGRARRTKRTPNAPAAFRSLVYLHSP